jgi:hypothetical protein
MPKPFRWLGNFSEMAGENTEARRDRVRTLWIKPDRQIAEILIDEGYAGAVPRTEERQQRQLATTQRNVWNDRAFWRKTWREAKRITTADANETRGEHLAVLDSYRDEGIAKLGDKKLKGTPFAQTLQALARIEELRAKATGVDELQPIDPEADKPKVPVVGLVLGTNQISPEMRAQLRDQGIEIGDAAPHVRSQLGRASANDPRS